MLLKHWFDMLSADAVWTLSSGELEQFLNTTKCRPKSIRFYAPGFAHYKTATFCNTNSQFPTISVTGSGCALNCKHCGGKVLETMHQAQTPEKLFELCSKLKRGGALGVLVSGGCLSDGSVPLEKFTSALGKIKAELELTVLVHTGIVKPEISWQLKTACVDAALVDVIGSNQTIQEIYNLNVTVQDYADSLKALHEAGVDFVPHVIVGLHHGQLKGELEALKIVQPFKPSAIVVIAFMPIHGTAMEQTVPSSPKDIAKVALAAKTLFPQVPVVLGCMRPKGVHRSETDVWALKAGVDGVAFPSQAAINFAKSRGDSVVFSPFCCAQIYKDLIKG